MLGRITSSRPVRKQQSDRITPFGAICKQLKRITPFGAVFKQLRPHNAVPASMQAAKAATHRSEQFSSS